MQNKECIFCKLANGEIPCYKVYEDKEVLAFLDIAPAVKRGGHTLVIPKAHYTLLTEIPEALLAKLMSVVKVVTKALLIGSDGVNVLQNNGRAAGQYVQHVHFHIVPRYNDDGIRIAHWEALKYAPGEIEKVQERVKELLGKVAKQD